MNVPTIEVTSEEARAKLKAYRSNLHKDAERMYSQCADVYEKIAAGAKIIDLAAAIDQAPRDQEHRPQLAIARADRKQVQVRILRHRWIDGRLMPMTAWYYSGDPERRGWHWNSLMVEVPLSGKHPAKYLSDGYARVPMVPADVRPATGNLRDWHILWDVEQWSDRPVIDPPRDPLLLRHLTGSLYQILAEWDLTEIERAVMRSVL